MTKVEKLYKKMADIHQQIINIQAVCPHTDRVMTPHASTDNWCKSDDRYYYDCVCKKCHKRWEEDQ
jgi:hypothetical protein